MLAKRNTRVILGLLCYVALMAGYIIYSIAYLKSQVTSLVLVNTNIFTQVHALSLNKWHRFKQNLATVLISRNIGLLATSGVTWLLEYKL